MGFFFKRLPIFAIPLLMATLISCNKDEEITVDNPETPTPETPGNGDFTVIEYMPAPGQFINDPASGFENITTMAEACHLAQERLAKNYYVSLGAWGGYLIVKTNTPIQNSGNYDFSIGGNSFDTSSEAGIVWVMQDTNKNGLPDDEWYQLKGSEFDNPDFIKDYQVTYYKADIKTDIEWKDNLGNNGVISWNGNYHSQDSYYPAWIKEDNYTLTGSLLPPNIILNSTTGQWSALPYKWGYADNFGEDSATVSVNGIKICKNFFKISDAVKSDGSPADISSIDFVKVQTGVNAVLGWLGEISTEICGFFRE